jgi:hypothetical protein
MQTTGAGGFSSAAAPRSGATPVGAPGDTPRQSHGRRRAAPARQAGRRRGRAGGRPAGAAPCGGPGPTCSGRCCPAHPAAVGSRRRPGRGPAPGPGSAPGSRRGRVAETPWPRLAPGRRWTSARPVGRQAGDGVNLHRRQGARSPGGPSRAPCRGRTAPAARGDGRLDLTSAQASEAPPAGGQAHGPRGSCRRCGRCRCRMARPATRRLSPPCRC